MNDDKEFAGRGIHAGNKEEVANTKAPEVSPGRKHRRVRSKLAARQEGWEAALKGAKHAQHKPGSLSGRK